MVENDDKSDNKISFSKKFFQHAYQSINGKQIIIAGVFICILIAFKLAFAVQNFSYFFAILSVPLFILLIGLISDFFLDRRKEYLKKNGIDSKKDKLVQRLSDIKLYCFKGLWRYIIYLLRSFHLIPSLEEKDIPKIKETVDKTGEATDEIKEAVNKIYALLKDEQKQDPSFNSSDRSNLIDSKESDKLLKEAILDVADIPGIEKELKEKGGQAIINHLLERIEKGATGEGLREAYRKIAEVAYRIGNIRQVEKSLGIILSHKENDLYAINRLGWIYQLQGNLQRAEMQYQKLMDLAPDNKDYCTIAYGNMGAVYFTQGNLEQAMEMYKKALKLNKELGHKERIAIVYGNMGVVYFKHGNLEQAMEMHEKSLKLKEELGNKQGMVSNYSNMGNIYFTQGRLDQAMEMHEKSLKLSEELGHKEGTASNYGNMGNIYFTQGRLDQAMELYKESLKLSEELGHKEGIAFNYNNIGSVYKIQGKPDKAREYGRNLLLFFRNLEIILGQKRPRRC